MMKKFLIFMLMCCVTLGFVSCSNDDDLSFEKEDLLGTWKVVDIEGYSKEDGKKTDVSIEDVNGRLYVFSPTFIYLVEDKNTKYCHTAMKGWFLSKREIKGTYVFRCGNEWREYTDNDGDKLRITSFSKQGAKYKMVIHEYNDDPEDEYNVYLIFEKLDNNYNLETN